MKTFPRISRRVNLIILALAVLGSVSLTHRAAAQIGFESLLGSISDIDVSFTCWSTSADLKASDCPGRKNGYGVEVLWAITRLPLTTPTTKTEWVPSERTVTTSDGRTETTVKEIQKQTRVARYSVALELGLGYGQFSGFQSADTLFEISGTVREIPSVAIYGTFEGPFFKYVQPYVGVRSGLIQLKGVQLRTPAVGDSTSVYSGTGDVFQIGGVLGLTAGGDRLSAFLEGTLNLRRFSSVQWNAGAGARQPEFFPTSLDFSGPSLSLGIQIHVRDVKP